LPFSETSEEDGERVPRQLQGRQLIVTLADATPEIWANLTKAISDDYGLVQIGAFPLTSLAVQCVVFQVTEDRPLEQVLAQLAADPRVESAQLNQVFTGLYAGARDYTKEQYGLRKVGADLAHAWVTGLGVRVAVIDTGADTEHPDLRGRIAQTTNFVEGGEQTFTSDLHGTAVAGVIGARADDNFGISGVAPDVDLLAVKACWHRQPKRSDAWCSSWTLAKAIDFAIVERVRVINLSLGGPADTLLTRLLLKAVEEHGITVVAAVNELNQRSSFPANLPQVIAVVASDPFDSVRAAPSNNPTLLAAPGVDVLTTVPNRAYGFLSGSSFAAAHISGIVALLLEGDPQLSPRHMMDLLNATARPALIRAAETTTSVRHVDVCAALERLVHAASCP
jgi:subtilisin family serine protease